MRNLAFILVIGLVGLGTLMSLGFWQLQRLEWKNGKIAEATAMIEAPSVALPATLDPESDRYRAAYADGRFDGPELHVLTSTREAGPGFRVISAFTLLDGRRILVDRGFIPEAARDTPRPPREARVEGNLNWPDDVTSSTPAPDRARGIWFGRDVPAMAAELGTLEIMLIARQPTGDGIAAMPATAAFKNDHLGYAVTWFGLALVWAGMTLGFLWRIRRPKM